MTINYLPKPTKTCEPDSPKYRVLNSKAFCGLIKILFIVAE